MNHPDAGYHICRFGVRWSTRADWAVWSVSSISSNNCRDWSIHCDGIISIECGVFIDDNEIINNDDDTCFVCGGGDSVLLEKCTEMETESPAENENESPTINPNEMPAKNPTTHPFNLASLCSSEPPTLHPADILGEPPTFHSWDIPSETPTPYPSETHRGAPPGFSTTAWPNYTIGELMFDQITLKNFDCASGISLSDKTHKPELWLFFNNIDLSKVMLDLRPWRCYGINGTLAGNGVDNDQLRLKIWYG